jgi:hypothetical protein
VLSGFQFLETMVPPDASFPATPHKVHAFEQDESKTSNRISAAGTHREIIEGGFLTFRRDLDGFLSTAVTLCALFKKLFISTLADYF